MIFVYVCLALLIACAAIAGLHVHLTVLNAIYRWREEQTAADDPKTLGTHGRCPGDGQKDCE